MKHFYCSPCSPARIMLTDVICSAVMTMLSAVLVGAVACLALGYRMEGSAACGGRDAARNGNPVNEGSRNGNGSRVGAVTDYHTNIDCGCVQPCGRKNLSMGVTDYENV